MRDGKVSMLPPDNEMSIQAMKNVARMVGQEPVVMRMPRGPKFVTTKEKVPVWKSRGAIEVK